MPSVLGTWNFFSVRKPAVQWGDGGDGSSVIVITAGATAQAGRAAEEQLPQRSPKAGQVLHQACRMQEESQEKSTSRPEELHGPVPPMGVMSSLM